MISEVFSNLTDFVIQYLNLAVLFGLCTGSVKGPGGFLRFWPKFCCISEQDIMEKFIHS